MRVALLSLLAAAVGFAAPPCTRATEACSEQVTLGAKGKWSLIYRTVPLGQRSDLVRRAFILIHGQGRNADDYFETAAAAAFLAGALEDTIAISPRLAVHDGKGCRDKLGEGEISWSCESPSWRGGAASISDPELTTYDFIDELVRRLADKRVFPNLTEIVVAGHSAGGQFVHRYATAARVDPTPGVTLRYLVSNPSSYLYLDETRLPASARCSDDGTCSGEFRPYSEGRNCTTYNHYLYGLANRTGYSAAESDDTLKSNLARRNVTYLLGDQDRYPIAGFDSSCPAMAQGPDRLTRGITYWNYINQRFQARHKLAIVPLCGHNARCMFTSQRGLSEVFGEKPARAAAPLPAGVLVARDLEYAKADRQPLLLDLFVPPGAAPRPLIVWIPDSTLRGGSRREPLAAALLSRGYAVASITYRLPQESEYPAQLRDCQAAIRWLRANAGGYGVDARRIAVWGESDGGQLAALVGTAGGAADRVQAVVSFYGNVRFEDPVKSVDPKDPPFLLVHGDHDDVAPLNRSQSLQESLERTKVPTRLLVVAEAKHGGPQFETNEVLSEVAAFLDKHLRSRR
jgi:acetyl esterase/lipase